MKAAHIERSAHCIKAIAHPLRLSILALLAEGERNVQDLTQALGSTQSNVSQHLFQMKARDLITARREGNKVFYGIANPKVTRLIALMREVFCED